MGEIRRKKIVIEKAKELFDCEYPDKFLFSILDFTALICKPQIPVCLQCPFEDRCKYQNKNL
jgi:adenine-specific DNA glycosylase